MKRREFMTLLGGAAAVWPLAARAQVPPKRRPLIAWLSGGGGRRGRPELTLPIFWKACGSFGYIEGRDFSVEYRFAEGLHDRLPVLAEEVVLLKPDVILAAAVDAAVLVRKATAVIPIVSAALADPVHLGLIASEARPGGNVTGVEPYVAGVARQADGVRARDRARRQPCRATHQSAGSEGPAPTAGNGREQVEALKIATVVRLPTNLVRSKVHCRRWPVQRVDVVLVLQTTMLLNLGQRIAELAIEEAAADRLRIPRACCGRRLDQLRRRFALVLSPHGPISWIKFCAARCPVTCP